MGNCCCKRRRKLETVSTSSTSKCRRRSELDFYYDDYDEAQNEQASKKRAAKAKKYIGSVDKTALDLTTTTFINQTSVVDVKLQQQATRAYFAGQGSQRRGADNSQIFSHFGQAHLKSQHQTQHASQSSAQFRLNQSLFGGTENETTASATGPLLASSSASHILNESTLSTASTDSSSSSSFVQTIQEDSATKQPLIDGQSERRLANRKRSSHLNQSLNENDVKHESLEEGDGLCNWKNYRSLQKSKRSIRTIEETMKSSRSIEQWLNDFGKLEEGERNKRRKSAGKVQIAAQLGKRSRTSLDENDENDVSEIEALFSAEHRLRDAKLRAFLNSRLSSACVADKLVESALRLLKENETNRVRSMETTLSAKLSTFLLPRSLANIDDIELLKWLLDEANLELRLSTPILSEAHFTDDRLTFSSEANVSFLLLPSKLKVRLIEELESSEDESNQAYLCYDPSEGLLCVDRGLVEMVLNKEKALAEKVVLQDRSIDAELLEDFRKAVLESANFKGARLLMNIKKKQILNGRVSRPQLLSPLSNKFDSNSSPSYSSTSSTSVSPASSLSPRATESTVPNYVLHHSDFNERLFSCFLSNFSCEIVDDFLKNSWHTRTGFVRKNKFDNQFVLVKIEAGEASDGRTSLAVENNAFKFCLRLDRWPSSLQNGFFERSRPNLHWPTKRSLDLISKSGCLITGLEEAEGVRWRIDTCLAESILFSSLSAHKAFIFYCIHLVLSFLSVEQTRPFKSARFTDFISQRVLLHHFFRFVELDIDDLDSLNAKDFISNLLLQLKSFSDHLRTTLQRFKTLNKPNYFEMNEPILNLTDQEMICRDEALLASDLLRALNEFHSALLSINQSKTSSVNLLNAVFDKMRPRLAGSSFIRCLPSHYSHNAYLYEYVYNFASELFNQFKAKKDQFAISEELLIGLHEELLARKASNPFVDTIRRIDRDCLFSKFEEYAECVHKYLPQIRNNNQYLLFHYIWTMQVQYLAPFFNYLCDFYSSEAH